MIVKGSRWVSSIVTLVMLMTFSTVMSHAESRSLYMPVLQSSESLDSSLTLINAGSASGTVTLLARSYDGIALSGPGIINPVSMTMPGSSSRTLSAREMFGPGVSSGWVELRTNSPAILGAFFLSDSKGMSMDSASLITAHAGRQVFLKATTDVSSSNRLVLINTRNDAIPNASVSLIENSGRLVTQSSISLAGFAGFSGGIADLMPDVRGFDGYVVVEEDSAESGLVGFETYRDGPDIAALDAVSGSGLLQGYFALFGNQSGHVSTLVLVNHGSDAQTISATAAILDTNGKNDGNTSLKTVDVPLAIRPKCQTQFAGPRPVPVAGPTYVGSGTSAMTKSRYFFQSISTSPLAESQFLKGLRVHTELTGEVNPSDAQNSSRES